MIGDMIAKIRKEKKITKTELARLTNINIGHLTHIEKGERNPSHKALKTICSALEIPYQQLMYTYDKTLNEEQENYGLVNYIPYNKVIAVENINSLIDCPANIPNSAMAIKMNDDSMEPKISKGSFVFIEFNTPLTNRDIGIFNLNNSTLIRKFNSKNGKIHLKAFNKNFEDIRITENDTFYIIGKVCL